ncbi:hypothetical protein Hypma_006775 [Hypsizygus marmoreus]|uniref:F-box domain-containing protein n=1 Tax=Hypsizygus marmoreus TaxID=39966 RepID=A0A369K163_HYPMA|nr:hypothetical protein Hypma_006775 [Hypsizygus marmoreus]
MSESTASKLLELPLELVQLVLKNLRSDLPTLRNLSAVCRALAIACRPYKWHRVYINAMRVHNLNTDSVSIRFLEAIAADQDIRDMVKELFLDDERVGLSVHGSSTQTSLLGLSHDPHLPRTIQMFPNLTTLHLSRLDWVSRNDLADAIRSVLSRVTDVAFVDMRFPLSTIFLCHATEHLYLCSVSFFEAGELGDEDEDEESSDDEDDAEYDEGRDMQVENVMTNNDPADHMEVDEPSASPAASHDQPPFPNGTPHVTNARLRLVSFHLLGQVGRRADIIWTYLDLSCLKTLAFSVPLSPQSVACFNQVFHARGYGGTVETLALECSEYIMDGLSIAGGATYTGGYPNFNYLTSIRTLLIIIPTWYSTWLTVLKTLLSCLNQGACAVVETITIVMLLDKPGSLLISDAHPITGWQDVDAEFAQIPSTSLTEVIFEVYTTEGDDSDILGLDVIRSGLQGLQAQGLLRVETTADLPFAD